jgi:uncharacterized protein
MGEACYGGGSRRRFLRTSAAAGAGVALASADAFAAAPPEAPVPLVTLGKTGAKVTKLGMGTSWALSPGFVQAALAAGVRYIDTSEAYENTTAEKVLGEVLDRTKMRKDVYLVTKISRFGRAETSSFVKHLEDSLARLQTDYVDCYYLHGVDANSMKAMKDPAVKAVFEGFKKAGKIRFCGLSCHDGRLPEILETAADVGWFDQVMFKYNFRQLGQQNVDRHDDLQRAIDKASKANLGLIAMKTQGGAINFPEKMKALQEKGFKKEVAAIKTVWMDDRMQVVVSEMTTRSDLRENIAASREALSPKEARLLEEHRLRTANLYCHGCGHLCETAANGVPVATVLRYLRYYSAYGKREQARALYQALPAQARDLAAADLAAAERACPFGLPVVQLVTDANRQLA